MRLLSWVRERVDPPAVRVRGITPGKFLKTQMLNPAFCCEISCFLKTTAKKLGGAIHCWSPNLKVGDQSLPVPTVVAPMCSHEESQGANRATAF